MNVLVACEYSGRVRDAFTERGHYAVSADLLPTESPGEHYQGDVRDLLHLDWDMMIAFPSCKFLAQTGSQWLYHKEDSPTKKPHLTLEERRPHPLHPHRREKRAEAIEFFMELANAPIPQICIENPMGCMSRFWRSPDQYVHPWWFGDEATKRTGLWLKNLPLLEPTNIVGKGEYVIQGGHRFQRWYSDGSKKDRSKRRALIFPGIARAMAKKWG